MNIDDYLRFIADKLKMAYEKNDVDEYKRLLNLAKETIIDTLNRLE